MTLKDIIRLFGKIVFLWFGMLILLFFIFKGKILNDTETRSHNYDLISDEKINKDFSIGINKEYQKIKQAVEKQTRLLNEKLTKLQKEKFRKEAKKYLIENVNVALSDKHYSPANQKVSYKQLCIYYPNYCKIIDVDSEFTENEKVYYTAITIYLIKYLQQIFPNIDNEIYYIKLQKEKKGRRGYAGHHSLVLNIKKDTSYKQFLEVLTHEIGHLVDLGVITGKSWFKDPNFTEFGKKSFAKDDKSLKFYKLSWISEKVKNPYIYAKDFVSGYALTDPFEDFAESFNMYVNHNSVFIKMSKESNILKQKYNFLNTLLKGEYLSSDRKFNYKLGFRPRDSTKMK